MRLNFIKFSRLNVIVNSNFAAHRWRCKHGFFHRTHCLPDRCLKKNQNSVPCTLFLKFVNNTRGLTCFWGTCSHWPKNMSKNRNLSRASKKDIWCRIRYFIKSLEISWIHIAQFNLWKMLFKY